MYTIALSWRQKLSNVTNFETDWWRLSEYDLFYCVYYSLEIGLKSVLVSFYRCILSRIIYVSFKAFVLILGIFKTLR